MLIVGVKFDPLAFSAMERFEEIVLNDSPSSNDLDEMIDIANVFAVQLLMAFRAARKNKGVL